MSRFFALLIFIIPLSASANLPYFSVDEYDAHLRHIDFIAEQSAVCLQNTWNDHNSFYQKWGVSKYYGDRNKSLDTREERLAALRQAGAPEFLINELVGTSCIGLTVSCLGQAFEATKDLDVMSAWAKVHRYVKLHDMSGVHLIKALRLLSWKVHYWNPNPAMNAAWDREDPTLLQGYPVDWDSGVKDELGRYIFNPGWGMHKMRYNTVMQKGKYYLNEVDDADLLVNFGTDVPKAFGRSPFFVGVAHAGYHVFPGFYGQVIEAHSTRQLTAIDNLEQSMFNPLAPGGGPRWSRVERYRSGVIAIPPVGRRP